MIHYPPQPPVTGRVVVAYVQKMKPAPFPRLDTKTLAYEAERARKWHSR